MDYNKIIDDIFNETSKNIIKKFKEDNELGRTFIKSIDGIIASTLEMKNNSIIYKNYDLFNNPIYDLKHCLDYYKKEVALVKVIEIDIKSDFEERIIKRKIIDLNDCEIIDYSFKDFILDLLAYDTLNKIENRLRNNSDLYELFYENNDYSSFTLEAFDGHVINSLLYKKVFVKFNPGKPVPIAIERIDTFGNKIYDIVTIEEGNNNTELVGTKKTETEINYILKQFEEDEKYFILHCFYKVIAEKKFDSKNIELSEFLRLIRICQNIEDTTVFDKKYTKKFYKRVSDGLQYSSNLSYRQKLKERTLNKLKDLQVPEVEEYMKSLKI